MTDWPSLVGALAREIRDGSALAAKRDIAETVAALGLSASDAIRVGDDCAAIPDGDGFLLLAIEGFLDGFAAAMPWFAGWCGVMVNLSDIAAMGGRPLAVVDALWSDGTDAARPVLDGLRDAARVYGVPIVGGHTSVRAASRQLAVAVLGRADRLLTSFDARPGYVLVAALDLAGPFTTRIRSGTPQPAAHPPSVFAPTSPSCPRSPPRVSAAPPRTSPWVACPARL